MQNYLEEKSNKFFFKDEQGLPRMEKPMNFKNASINYSYDIEPSVATILEKQN
jgi:hypothetical protein